MSDARGDGSSESVSLWIRDEHAEKSREEFDREGESRATAGGGSTTGFYGRDQKHTGVTERRAKVQAEGVSEGEK